MKIHHATVKKAAKFHITLSIEDNEVVATAKDGTRLASGLQGNKVLEDAITRATGKPAKGNGATRSLPPTHPAIRGAGKAVKKANKAARRAEVEAHSEEEAELDDEDGEDSDAEQSKSIVKAKYKALYKPHKDKSGDDLSFEINKHCSRENAETGEMRIDRKALEKFAKANDCWVASYGSLVARGGGWNAGMARMNVANRLRAKVRRAKKDDEIYEIVWA